MTNPDTLDLNLASAADKRVAVPYGSSDDVRELLALLAVPVNGMELADELQRARDAAFSNVIAKIGQGLIELDYQPFEKGTVDIPAIDHPHYMQALLYWSTLLHCTPAQLVDVYARLGSLASAESVFGLLRRIREEELVAGSTTEPTQRPQNLESTQPIFANTSAQVLK